MERVHAANPEPHLTELAHHFFQAAPGGDVDKAIDYATPAAQRASRSPPTKRPRASTTSPCNRSNSRTGRMSRGAAT